MHRAVHVQLFGPAMGVLVSFSGETSLGVGNILQRVWESCGI